MHMLIYQALKDSIVELGLLPGEAIKTSDLETKYGVSRTPVRDALLRLSQEGLVDIVPRKGYFVSRIKMKDVEEVLNLRILLEGAAVRAAAKNITPAQIEQAKRSLSARYVVRDRSSYKVFFARNRAFHMAIAEASENTRLARMIGQVIEETTRISYMGLDVRDSAVEMEREHLELLRALEEGDGEKAYGLLIRQLENLRNRIVESIGGR